MATTANTPRPDGLRDMYGRGMNTTSEQYMLPVDKDEHDRLSIQHRTWVLMMDGLYPAEARDHISRLLELPSKRGETPKVLDLGTGSGHWAAEMAKNFPHAEVLGLDLAKPNIQTYPPNCSFIIADVTKGLPQYAEKFDVVHCRCVAAHVVDRVGLVRTLASVLKRGGLLLLGDGNQEIYTPDKVHIPRADTTPGADNSRRLWISLWMDELVNISSAKNRERVGGAHLAWFIQHEPQLEFLGTKPFYVPVNWDGDGLSLPNGKELGRLVTKSLLGALSSAKPLLLQGSGVSADTIDEWQRKAYADLVKPPMRYCCKRDMAWALKRS